MPRVDLAPEMLQALNRMCEQAPMPSCEMLALWVELQQVVERLQRVYPTDSAYLALGFGELVLGDAREALQLIRECCVEPRFAHVLALIPEGARALENFCRRVEAQQALESRIVTTGAEHGAAH